MHVFELRYPGRSLNDPAGGQIQKLLRELESSLARAGVSLSLYEVASTAPRAEPSWMRQRPVAIAIERELREGLPADLTPDQQREAFLQSPGPDLLARRQEWGQGVMPDDYKFQLPFIYAHEVLYALDAMGSLLRVLAKTTGREEVQAALKDFQDGLPNLRDIRNSAHHMEDRIRGLKTGEKPIELKPVKNEFFEAPFGTLSLNNIFNNKLGYVAGDGNYYQIEISIETVTTAQKAIQRAIDGLEWKDNHVRIIPH